MSRDRDDRPSWREIDRRREHGRDDRERRPQGEAARARADQATKQYLKEIDGVFAGGEARKQAEALARDVRDALGTPRLAEACRAYRDALGAPSDPSLIGCFLDSGDVELLREGLRALRAALDAGGLDAPGGLRSQLRMLEQHDDDEVAETAEELLAEL